MKKIVVTASLFLLLLAVPAFAKKHYPSHPRAHHPQNQHVRHHQQHSRHHRA